MKLLIFALSCWLALPIASWGATAGTSCNSDFPGLGAKAQCIYLCSTIATTGGQSCGPIAVPMVSPKHVTVRVVSQVAAAGTQFHDCTFATGGDIIGLMRSTDSVSSGYRPVYGTLDSDAIVLELKIYGPIDPYMGMNGMTTVGANCTTAEHGFDIIAIFYEESSN